MTKRHPTPITSLPSHIKYLLIDCDGVLFLQSKLLHPEIPSILNSLREQGIEMVFVTNNSTKSRQQYKEKMTQMGMEWVQKEDIYVSGYLASVWLSQRNVKNVYLIGEQGLHQELHEHGINVMRHSDAEKHVSMSEGDVAKVPEDELRKHEYVVIGWDRSFTFYKCCYACMCLQQKREDDSQCGFIATNVDSFDKVDEFKNIPGSGAMVGSVQAGSGREAQVIGKPSTFAVELLEKTRGWKRENMLMIGDRLDSDILMANRAGIASLLVYSGTTNRALMQQHVEEESIVPTYSIEDLSKLEV
eukprot:CAMPEP_0117448634 /NCGR_PEP_ID=MMETSP0759-20121206/7508_1 /TAXON_ID=63605 /ORGANISM="Percolomonas cosmopolitus, Strain WS" /LENGTH=301 /DNA_ID=CAMNT_0005241039 /DNA_START=56 /DNA_END=961 /DNA_ORIENTATION=+